MPWNRAVRLKRRFIKGILGGCLVRQPLRRSDLASSDGTLIIKHILRSHTHFFWLLSSSEFLCFQRLECSRLIPSRLYIFQDYVENSCPPGFRPFDGNPAVDKLMEELLQKNIEQQEMPWWQFCIWQSLSKRVQFGFSQIGSSGFWWFLDSLKSKVQELFWWNSEELSIQQWSRLFAPRISEQMPLHDRSNGSSSDCFTWHGCL